MKELQKRFFEHLAQIQKSCVEICLAEHKLHDEETERMLYDVTYAVITEIMEMIDGYSAFSEHKHDIVDMVTKAHLKEDPFIELHDQTEDHLRHGE